MPSRRNAPVGRLDWWFAAVIALLLSGCGPPPTPPAPEPAEPPPPPLTEQQVGALDNVYDRVHSLLVIEVVRPRQAEHSAEDLRLLTFRLRVGQTLVDGVSTDHVHHYAVARTLGALYATATSIGWPAAPFIAERFLQRAVELDPLDPSAWESLGLLHMLTGDIDGAIHYLETARALASQPTASIQIALGQSYYLAGESEQAESALQIIIERMPDAELPRDLLAIIRSGDEFDPTELFRTPPTPTAEPFRSSRVVTALDWPMVVYENTAHGFGVRIPWRWTLAEETLDRAVDPCTRVAEVAFELPIAELGADPPQTRIRLTALPVGGETAARDLAEMREPIFAYPDAVDEVPPVVTGSVHQLYRDPDAGRDGRAGEVVFVVHEGMGFILHLASTPAEYDDVAPAFATFLEGFSARGSEAWRPAECGGERPL